MARHLFGSRAGLCAAASPHGPDRSSHDAAKRRERRRGNAARARRQRRVGRRNRAPHHRPAQPRRHPTPADATHRAPRSARGAESALPGHGRQSALRTGARSLRAGRFLGVADRAYSRARTTARARHRAPGRAARGDTGDAFDRGGSRRADRRAGASGRRRKPGRGDLQRRRRAGR